MQLINHQPRPGTLWSPKETKLVTTHRVMPTHQDVCGLEVGRTNWGEHFGRGFRAGPGVKVSWLHPLPVCKSVPNPNHSLCRCRQTQPLCYTRYPTSRLQTQQQPFLTIEHRLIALPQRTSDHGPPPAQALEGLFVQAFLRKDAQSPGNVY